MRFAARSHNLRIHKQYVHVLGKTATRVPPSRDPDKAPSPKVPTSSLTSIWPVSKLGPLRSARCLTLITDNDLNLIDKADKTQHGSFVPPVPCPQGMKAHTTLGLAELPDGPVCAAAWIGPLVALRARAWRSLAQIPGKQLIITVTVPRRDLAAVLVGCGWLMAHPAPVLRPPIETLRQLAPGTPVRLVTDGIVSTSVFRALDERNGQARALMHGGVGWLVGKINALCGLPELERPERAARPSPGVAAEFAGLDREWDARLACPPTDLAIVGTRVWLLEDARAYLTVEGRTSAPPTQISDLLLPKGVQPAMVNTAVLVGRIRRSAAAAVRILAVILDGAGAVKYLDDVEAPVVVCIIDRSIADETAAEFIVQRRNGASDPVAVASLGWRSVPGIEALAFTVPR